MASSVSAVQDIGKVQEEVPDVHVEGELDGHDQVDLPAESMVGSMVKGRSCSLPEYSE